MDTNSQTLFAVRQAEHQIRLRQSERIREAEQAAGLQPGRLLDYPFRAWISSALIAAGERLQDKIAAEPKHAASIREMNPSR